MTDSDFNGILVNRYLDRNHYIGPHSDDETSLGRNGVVTLSIGATRTFRVRDKKTKEKVVDIKVNHSDMYWMKGNFQRYYTHEIPKEKCEGARMSLTFRKHIE